MPPSLNLHSRQNFSPNQRGHIATACLSALSAVTGDTFTSYRKNHPWVIIEHVPLLGLRHVAHLKVFRKRAPASLGESPTSVVLPLEVHFPVYPLLPFRGCWKSRTLSFFLNTYNLKISHWTIHSFNNYFTEHTCAKYHSGAGDTARNKTKLW